MSGSGQNPFDPFHVNRDPTHDSVLVTKRNVNPKLRVAANNAAARNAGVRLGGLYRTAAGVVMVRTV